MADWTIEWKDGPPREVWMRFVDDRGDRGGYAYAAGTKEYDWLKQARADAERATEQRVRAERDGEWLTALAAEFADADEYCESVAVVRLDNVAERMGLGEVFEARVGQKGGG